MAPGGRGPVSSSSVGNDAGDVVSTMLVLDTGLGFRSAVWHQIARLLCRLDEVYICDGCRRPAEPRHQRATQSGRLCPTVARMAKQPSGCGQRANAPSCRRRRTCRRRSYKKSSVSEPAKRGIPQGGLGAGILHDRVPWEPVPGYPVSPKHTQNLT